MSFNEWKSENMTGFETWKAENKQVKTGGGGLAEFGKGVVDAYLLGAKGAIGTAETLATIPPAHADVMMGGLGIGWGPEGEKRQQPIKVLREAQAKIESARGRFEMTHAGVSAKAGRILGNAVGYMSQAMAGGYTAGPIGAAMVGFNIEGQSAYDDAIKSGATETQAQNERLIVGSINAGIEALQIGRLMKFQQAGKHSIKNFIRLAKQRAYKRMAATGKQFGADILRHSIEEGLEEFAQEGVSVSIPALFRDEYPKKEDGTVDLWALGERLGAAFVGGTFAGGVLGAAGQVQISGKKVSESIPEAMDINELLGYGHAIPEALGMQDEERRAYMESLIGKRSMSDMNPRELEDLMWQLRKDADAAGIDLNKLVQQFQPSVELNKQMQSLRRYKKPLGEFEQRRKGKILKAADWVKGKVESYLLRQDRMKNITRMLDGYKEDGPMSRLIFDPVKTASVKAKDAANQLMYNLRLSAQDRGIDIGKMFDRKPLSIGAGQDKIKAAAYFNPNTGEIGEGVTHGQAAANLKGGVAVPEDQKPVQEGFVTESGRFVSNKEATEIAKKTKQLPKDYKLTQEERILGRPTAQNILAQFVPETKAKGKDILLSDSEAIGIYYLAQNPKARKNIEAIFKEDGVDPKTAIQSINDYVEKNEDFMYVYRDARAYFDTMGPRFFDVVKQLDIKGVVQEQNYITMLLNKGDEEGTADIMAEMADQFGFPTPGKKHTKERTGAIRSMNMDIFSITAQASRSLERFINVAPVIKRVNKLIEKKSFKDNLNAVTKGKGVRIFKKWLADSARGSSNVNMNSIDETAIWLRRNAVLYTLGAKIFTVVPKQAISLSNAVAKRPAMLPVVLKTIDRMADPRVSKQLEERAVSKSKLVKNRDWERDLRKVWTTANIKKFFKGKKLSPIAMRSITWMDRKTVTVVWNSAYDLALVDLDEKHALKYADDMVQTTQPMASTEDLPDYFRGGAIPKALTTFMNQRNQNWQFLRHDILGEYKAGNVGKGMAMYRFLFSQILPSMMLGMITRGRLPKDAKEMALDLGSYIITPQIFLGRFLWNMATGEW